MRFKDNHNIASGKTAVRAEGGAHWEEEWGEEEPEGWEPTGHPTYLYVTNKTGDPVSAVWVCRNSETGKPVGWTARIGGGYSLLATLAEAKKHVEGVFG